MTSVKTSLQSQLTNDIGALQLYHQTTTEILSKLRVQLEQNKIQPAPQLAGGGNGGADGKMVSQMAQDMKNLSAVVQKFMEEHMNDKLIVIRSKNKSFE